MQIILLLALGNLLKKTLQAAKGLIEVRTHRKKLGVNIDYELTTPTSQSALDMLLRSYGDLESWNTWVEEERGCAKLNLVNEQEIFYRFKIFKKLFTLKLKKNGWVGV